MKSFSGSSEKPDFNFSPAAASSQAATPRLFSRRLLSAFVLLLVLRVLAADGYRGAIAPGGLFSVDYGTIYAAAKRLDTGSLYLREEKLSCQFTCSPLIPMLVHPLTKYPLDQSTRLWALVSVSTLVGACLLFCWGRGAHILDDVVPVVLILATAFRFWPTVIEFAIGNTHIILLALVGGMYVCDRHRKWMLFAALAAVASLVVTWMIGVLFYLMVRREWRAVFAGIAFFAGGLLVLFAMLGWDQWMAFVQVTRDYSSQSFLLAQSVAGMARMYFSVNLQISPFMDSRFGWWAVMLLGYGGLISGLLYLYLRGPRMNTFQLRMTLGLVVAALILGCPVSHLYYYVLVLPLLWTLLIEVQGCAQGLRIGAFAVYLALSYPSPGMDPVPEKFRNGVRSLAVSTTFLASMAAWGMGLFAALSGGALNANALQTTRPRDLETDPVIP